MGTVAAAGLTRVAADRRSSAAGCEGRRTLADFESTKLRAEGYSERKTMRGEGGTPAVGSLKASAGLAGSTVL